ncbi:MAG: chemotaxis protein CheA, partial [Desulforhopalus sp.]|nr:chemotaxis protein CheA [Desulforhopalus sp.]
AIKGKIDVQSTPGQGTTIILRIPLTMAIIDGMLLRTGSSKYILPILSIKESFQPTPDAITVSPDGQELVKVRDNLLPILRLHELHNITSDYDHLSQGILVVVEGRESTFCLYIDELLGQQQTVIKGLSDYINKTGDVGGVSGCTILGSGDVCLILDVRSLEELI